MSENMSSVVEQLRAEETRLVALVREFQGKASDAASELERVRAGIAALGGKSSARRKPGKPAVTQDEVLAAMREVLRSAGPLAKEELKERVGEVLRAQGKALTGYDFSVEGDIVGVE